MHIRHQRWLRLLLTLASVQSAFAGEATTPVVQELRRFAAPDATQAVAVDDEHFYAIGNCVIAKYTKRDGKCVTRWEATSELPLVHLNSGIVLDGKLYCAHSNFPHCPETSSVEIWDAKTLEHIDSHSLGVTEGSLTWIDWHHHAWWACFAHYTKRVNDSPHAKDSRWTMVVQFDRDWRRQAGWVFPPQVIERFEPHSCSGGSWHKGLLYCTGHDRGELYELALPKAGSALTLRRTLAVPITGQGFAWDRTAPGTLYGIDRPTGEVVIVQVPTAAESQSQAADR